MSNRLFVVLGVIYMFFFAVRIVHSSPQSFIWAVLYLEHAFIVYPESPSVTLFLN